MLNIQQFAEKNAVEIQSIRTALATNFDAPAQRIINAGFNRMGVDRFDRVGNDLWEMLQCHKNGWEYEKPPARLAQRWASY